MSEEIFKLSKSQYKFISQIIEYIDSEEIFSKKESIDVLSYEDVPGLEHHPSKMGVHYTLSPKEFKEGLIEILKTRKYNKLEKHNLKIIRYYCEEKQYPFHNFTYDYSKEIDKKYIDSE